MVIIASMLFSLIASCTPAIEEIPAVEPMPTITENVPTPEPSPEPTPEPIRHTISFDPNSGYWRDESTDIITITVENGSTLENFLPEPPERPSLERERFFGWAYNTPGAFEELDEKKPVTDDITLIAVWISQTLYWNIEGQVRVYESIIVDENGLVDFEYVYDTENFVVSDGIIDIIHIGAENETTLSYSFNNNSFYINSNIEVRLHEGVTFDVSNLLPGFGAVLFVNTKATLVNKGTIILNPGVILAVGDETSSAPLVGVLLNEGLIVVKGNRNMHTGICLNDAEFINKGSLQIEGAYLRLGLIDGTEPTIVNDGEIILDAGSMLVMFNGNIIDNGTFINRGLTRRNVYMNW